MSLMAGAPMFSPASSIRRSPATIASISTISSASPHPTLILINPPFSRSAGRGVDQHAGARHLRSALARLAPGGRCVAIMPPNFASGGTAVLGYTAVTEMLPPRAEITICGHPYAKHGTSIG
jgi:hypothetical protein